MSHCPSSPAAASKGRSRGEGPSRAKGSTQSSRPATMTELGLQGTRYLGGGKGAGKKQQIGDLLIVRRRGGIGVINWEGWPKIIMDLLWRGECLRSHRSTWSFEWEMTLQVHCRPKSGSSECFTGETPD